MHDEGDSRWNAGRMLVLVPFVVYGALALLVAALLLWRWWKGW